MAPDLPEPCGIPCMDALREAWQEIRDEALCAREQSPLLNVQRSRDWDENCNIELPRDGWVRAWRPDSGEAHNQWLNFGLFVGGESVPSNRDLCPKTMALLSDIPGLNVAGFSWLLPGGVITPHTDWNPGTRTWHLGLSVPTAPIGSNMLCVKNEIHTTFLEETRANPLLQASADGNSFIESQGNAELQPEQLVLDKDRDLRVKLTDCTFFEEADGKLLNFDDGKEHFAFNHSAHDRIILYLNIDYFKPSHFCLSHPTHAVSST